MFARTKLDFLLVVLLGVAEALKIDNQLAVIKNDCYERLAIGQRHDAKDVYKTSHVATVLECQLFCTKEKELCKSFSFGIAAKGNSSCELGNDLVKETADLKPIGTKPDTDFDLYIKKLGCTLVIDKNNPAFSHHKPDKPSGYSTPKPESVSTAKPSYSRPEEGVQHVQTLVSISSGPQKPILHPVHEILVSEDPYSYARPPFRPSALNHPYHRPFRPDPDRYDSRPGGTSLVPEKYGSYIPRPENYYIPGDGYNYRPPFDNYNYYRPSFDDYHQRPRPSGHKYEGYNEYRPNSIGGYNDKPNDAYNRPNPPSDYNQRPNTPSDGYNTPNSDYIHRPGSDYNRPNRPKPGLSVTSDDYNRPSFPSDYNNRPSSDYNQRPTIPNDAYNMPRPTAPNEGYHRPNPPSDYNERPNRPSSHYSPSRPGHDYNRPNSNEYNRPNPPSDDNARPNRPSSDYNQSPSRPGNDYNRPNTNEYNRPNPSSDYNERPNRPNSDYNQIPNRPASDHNRPDSNEYDRPNPPSDYSNNRPSKPTNEYLFNGETDRHDQTAEKPVKPIQASYDNTINGGSSNPKDPHSKPIVTQSIGPNGESITSIITEIDEACFRRVLAGKRVTRSLVRRALFCERVEDCQRECADEKRFVCEGFNHRLDPSGRGKGECELLDIPLSHLDIGRDLYPDRDYDYYERDRNAGTANCRRRQNDAFPNRRYDQRPPPFYDDRWYDERNRYGNRRPRPDFDDGYRPSANRRGDFAYHQSHHSEHSHNYHYEHFDSPPFDYKAYEPYLPPRGDRERDRPHWGSYGGSYGTNNNPHEFNRRNYYLPPDTGYTTKDWGQYGGSYGNGGFDLQYNGYGHSQSFDFWGLDKHEQKFHNYGELPPNKRPTNGGGYLPQLPYKPPVSGGGSYLPQLPYKPPGSGGGSYLPDSGLQPPFGNRGSYVPRPPNHDTDYNAVLPAEPRYPLRYDFLKDECSLRSAAGFRLTKGIIKKYYSVPNLYECEILCFKEKEFACASYAYKYSLSLNAPKDNNCYLSNRNYKELDFYTDLEPDRDFDVYTMNNMKKCEQPAHRDKDNSECFWRVRSAQRLDHKIVRDSLIANSIVECQIECLKSRRFTCRAFSYRYGSPVIGGPVDNCLLTDWPYYELDPRIHFVPEPGFEVYERGSFGHGCEPNHFGIKGRPLPKPGTRVDQLCYIGYGSPANLLPQATRKEIHVPNEEECKAECSKLRETTLFQCMSLSFTTKERWGPNCKLSDILQRDLLPNVDYIPDPDVWLFAWDNYNPECRAVANEPLHNHLGHKENRHIYDEYHNALGTWRVYSVSGWPCRRGSLCQENREAGFWFCELEGGDANAWDYCCRPDHQCGFSEGFPYQWCYVGPSRTQWRKCSDRYYPYVHNIIDRFDQPPTPWIPSGNNYLPDNRPPSPHRPGFRPDRPAAPPTRPPPRPSLDEYEMQFDSQFLDPPKPGGFGQPRHWPLSYLHKEMPPNNTDTDSRLMKGGKPNPKFAAIQNLIDVIKSNDLKNVQYQITNESNKEDDILFVRIPLPTNFTQHSRKNEKIVSTVEQSVSGPIDIQDSNNSSKRVQKSLPLHDTFVPTQTTRRGFITRTNVTRSRPSRRL